MLLTAEVGACRESYSEVLHFYPADLNGEGQLRYGVKSVQACQAQCTSQPDCARSIVQQFTQYYFSPCRKAEYCDEMSVSQLSMGWIDPCVGLDWLGLGRDFSVFGGLDWVHYSKSRPTKILK